MPGQLRILVYLSRADNTGVDYYPPPEVVSKGIVPAARGFEQRKGEVPAADSTGGMTGNRLLLMPCGFCGVFQRGVGVQIACVIHSNKHNTQPARPV